MEWQELLRDLINLVETTAPHLWEIAIRQVYVEAIEYVIFLLFFLGISIGLFVMAKTCWNKYKKENDFDYAGFSIILGVFGFVAFVLTIIQIQRIIGPLINPEYYAIEILIDYIK